MKSLKKMMVAWGAALTLLIAIGVLLEMAYSPEQSQKSDNPAEIAPPQADSSSKASIAIPQQAHLGDTIPASSRFISSDSKEQEDAISILPPPTFVVVQEDPEIIEAGATGLLPKRGADGQVAWHRYASPLPIDEELPRIAIIITDMGLNKKQTTSAIEKIPAGVNFAFSPYGLALNDWRNLARSTGHEILMLVPMEPINYPQNNPGTLTLLTTEDPLKNKETLNKIMGKLVGYVGMMNHMGDKFMTQQPSLRPILNEINARGLMFVDAQTTQFSKGASIAQSIGLPRATNDTFIDEITSREEILVQLQDLKNRARARGVAVGVARNYPMSITIIEKWSKGLADQGFQLVPITATVNRQPIS